MTVREERCASKSGKVRRTPNDCGPTSPLSIYDFILRLIPFATEDAAFPRLIPNSALEMAAGSPTGGLINGFFRAARVVVLTYASHTTLPISPHLGFLPGNAGTY